MTSLSSHPPSLWQQAWNSPACTKTRKNFKTNRACKGLPEQSSNFFSFVIPLTLDSCNRAMVAKLTGVATHGQGAVLISSRGS